MRKEVPVTVRVPAELKERVDALAAEVGISSSAVWKILLHRSVKPLLDGEAFRALDIFGADEKEDSTALSAARSETQPEAPAASAPGTSSFRLPVRRPPR